MFRSLNGLKFTDENIENVKKYILTRQLPTTLSPFEQQRFRNNFKDFIIEDGKLIYEPKHLEVIKDSDIDETLKTFLYDNPVYGIATGIKTFYNSVVSKYLNIPRKRVKEFLETKTTYQLTKPEPLPSKNQYLLLTLIKGGRQI